MNLLVGTVSAVGADGVTVRYDSGDVQRVGVVGTGAQVGDKVTVGIRPEHVLVDHSEDGVRATVLTIESLGDAGYLYAQSPLAVDGLIARIPPLERRQKGSQVKFGAAPEHCHLFNAEGSAYPRKFIEQLQVA
jgi:multiple sugar transport system ATP-binding protein